MSSFLGFVGAIVAATVMALIGVAALAGVVAALAFAEQRAKE